MRSKGYTTYTAPWFASLPMSFHTSILKHGKTFMVGGLKARRYVNNMLTRCDLPGKMAHENGAAALEKEPEFFAPAFNESDSLVRRFL